MSLKYRATPITSEPISLIIENEYLDESEQPSFEIITTTRQPIRRNGMKTSRTVEGKLSQHIDGRYPPPRSISSSQMRKNRTICMSNKSSRSPSPYISTSSRGRSYTPSLHFHKCNNEQCLNETSNRECCGDESLLRRECSFTKDASPAFSVSSFRSERKVDLKNNNNGASSFKIVKRELTPVKFSIKLNANDPKAAKNRILASNIDEFDSSFLEENCQNVENSHDYRLRNCTSPFTSIETMAIKRDTRKSERRFERSYENENRSSRFTPSRSISYGPKQTHRTVLLTKISPSSKTSQNIQLKVLKIRIKPFF
jgi:hypothetical protein